MNILSISLVGFLLIDQLLALITPFSSGIGLVVFIALLVISAIPKLLQKTNNISDLIRSIRPLWLLVALIMLAYSLIAASIAPCNGFWFFSVATTILVLLTWMFLQIYINYFDVKQIVEPKHALIGLIIIYICLCMAILGSDLYSLLLHVPTNRPSGLYLEPSHLILYASPLMFTVISNQQTRMFGILLTVFIFVLAYTVTNVALTILVILCYTVHFLLSRFRLANTKSLFVIFLVMTLFAVTLHGSYLSDRLDTSKNTGKNTSSFSTLVYLNGWLLAKTTILNTSGMGLGLGDMGCSETINNDNNTLSAKIKSYGGNVDHKIICVRDGSFLASKIISELGVVGVLLIGFIVYNLVIVLRKMLNYEFDIIVAGSICLIAILLFERGLAYFAAPVIYCLISIIHSQKVLK